MLSKFCPRGIAEKNSTAIALRQPATVVEAVAVEKR